ncbi:unnamed protein product [Sphagnum jensenii]
MFTKGEPAVLNRQSGQWPNAATNPVIPRSGDTRETNTVMEPRDTRENPLGPETRRALGMRVRVWRPKEEEKQLCPSRCLRNCCSCSVAAPSGGGWSSQSSRRSAAAARRSKEEEEERREEAAKATTPPSKKSEQKAKKAAAAASNEADVVDPFTPPGEKKLLAPEMAKSYNPKAVEASGVLEWYEWWEKSGFFVADPESKKPPFVIVVPPRNVTGAFHIGHALTGAIEDMLVRWRRMSGYNTLWVPGVDHAGIATQVVVEKKIMKEGNKRRHDLGQEQFVAEVYKWKEQSGGTICNQFRRTGMSLDWSREVYSSAEWSLNISRSF